MSNIKQQIRDIVLTEEEKELLDQNNKDWYPWQEDVLNSDSDYIGLIGARQTGKTELIIEWARRNNALILVENHARKDDIRWKMEKMDIQRSPETVEVYQPEKTKFKGMNVAIDEIQEAYFGTANRVLWCATDTSPKKTAFNDFCFDERTDVYTSDAASCPGVSEEKEEEMREWYSPENIVREMDGKIVIDPDEL
jgi:hypothetical protein